MRKYPVREINIALMYLRNSHTSTRAFTLLEVIVAITILSIVTIGTYVPYNYYTSLARVRTSAEIIEQSLSDARVLATGGATFPWSDTNADVGLYLSWGSSVLEIRTIRNNVIGLNLSNDVKILKRIELEAGVRISSVPSDRILIRYSAPHGDRKIYRTDGSEISGTGATVTIGLDGATTGPLSRTIRITTSR